MSTDPKTSKTPTDEFWSDGILMANWRSECGQNNRCMYSKIREKLRSQDFRKRKYHLKQTSCGKGEPFQDLDIQKEIQKTVC